MISERLFPGRLTMARLGIKELTGERDEHCLTVHNTAIVYSSRELVKNYYHAIIGLAQVCATQIYFS